MAPGGRPSIGEPVNIRFSTELLAAVDLYADDNSISRAEAVRRLTTNALLLLENPQFRVPLTGQE